MYGNNYAVICGSGGLGGILGPLLALARGTPSPLLLSHCGTQSRSVVLFSHITWPCCSVMYLSRVVQLCPSGMSFGRIAWPRNSSRHLCSLSMRCLQTSSWRFDTDISWEA